MKKLLTYFLLVAISFAACRKDDSKTPSPTSSTSSGGSTSTVTKTGTIQFVNNSSNPYYVYINGALKGTMDGQSTIKYTVDYGSYSCRVLQKSGYLLYPTDQTYTGVVSSTTTNLVVSFP